jgi:hypothetical protein
MTNLWNDEQMTHVTALRSVLAERWTVEWLIEHIGEIARSVAAGVDHRTDEPMDVVAATLWHLQMTELGDHPDFARAMWAEASRYVWEEITGE